MEEIEICKRKRKRRSSLCVSKEAFLFFRGLKAAEQWSTGRILSVLIIYLLLRGEEEEPVKNTSLQEPYFEPFFFFLHIGVFVCVCAWARDMTAISE